MSSSGLHMHKHGQTQLHTAHTPAYNAYIYTYTTHKPKTKTKWDKEHRIKIYFFILNWFNKEGFFKTIIATMHLTMYVVIYLVCMCVYFYVCLYIKEVNKNNKIQDRKYSKLIEIQLIMWKKERTWNYKNVLLKPPKQKKVQDENKN